MITDVCFIRARAARAAAVTSVTTRRRSLSDIADTDRLVRAESVVLTEKLREGEQRYVASMRGALAVNDQRLQFVASKFCKLVTKSRLAYAGLGDDHDFGLPAGSSVCQRSFQHFELSAAPDELRKTPSPRNVDPPAARIDAFQSKYAELPSGAF
jgi:hypothetical protein